MTQTAVVKHKAHTHTHSCWVCFIAHLTLEAFFLQLYPLKTLLSSGLPREAFGSGLLNDAQEIPRMQGRRAAGGEMQCGIARCFQEVCLLCPFLSSAPQS